MYIQKVFIYEHVDLGVVFTLVYLSGESWLMRSKERKKKQKVIITNDIY